MATQQKPNQRTGTGPNVSITETATNKKVKKLKPVLVNKLELPGDTINKALFIPHEESVISISTDKSVRVWIQRSNGQFWPSICHYMPDIGTCIDYDKESGKVFVGLNNGHIQEYDLSDDCNKLTIKRNYVAHHGRVQSILFILDYSWLLSCGTDKCFQWYCTKSGTRLGGFATKAVCTCVQFDAHSCYVFMGCRSGEIHVIKLTEEGLKPITILKGHSDSVQALSWDAEKKLLYSGSYDRSIIIWDIGGQKGSAVELHGHMGKVKGVALASHINKLFTVADDQVLVVWNTSAERMETPTWSQSDICERCSSPFFWNFRQMWDKKVIGVRQHHCRNCGRAICVDCSQQMCTIPRLGYEFEVRVCEECFVLIEDEDKRPTATFHEIRHYVNHLSIDISKGRLLTCGMDHIIKIWDIQGFIADV